MIIHAKVDGADKAVAALKSMNKGLAKRAIRNAVRAGAQPMVRYTRVNAKAIRDTGALAKNVTTRGKTKQGMFTQRISFTSVPRLGTDKQGKQQIRNPLKYAHLVELGHRIAVSGLTKRSTYRHILVRRGKSRIATSRNPLTPNVEAVNAGFVPGRPFMSTSFDMSKTAQLKALAEKLSNEIVKLANEVAK